MGAGVRLCNPWRRNSAVLAGYSLDATSAWLSAKRAHVAGDKLASDQAVLAEKASNVSSHSSASGPNKVSTWKGLFAVARRVGR
ncbi:hypothetical protein AJ88_37960 [Mesorhizobium amorphae CCBAU 01583]|nr:hypothetical protein AJ88_37960 [Mesorhizobium amorphae CCBAU 01583]